MYRRIYFENPFIENAYGITEERKSEIEEDLTRLTVKYLRKRIKEDNFSISLPDLINQLKTIGEDEQEKDYIVIIASTTLKAVITGDRDAQFLLDQVKDNLVTLLGSDEAFKKMSRMSGMFALIEEVYDKAK